MNHINICILITHHLLTCPGWVRKQISRTLAEYMIQCNLQICLQRTALHVQSYVHSMSSWLASTKIYCNHSENEHLFIKYVKSNNYSKYHKFMWMLTGHHFQTSQHWHVYCLNSVWYNNIWTCYKSPWICQANFCAFKPTKLTWWGWEHTALLTNIYTNKKKVAHLCQPHKNNPVCDELNWINSAPHFSGNISTCIIFSLSLVSPRNWLG
jgi:hypothetical protein